MYYIILLVRILIVTERVPDVLLWKKDIIAPSILRNIVLCRFLPASVQIFMKNRFRANIVTMQETMQNVYR